MDGDIEKRWKKRKESLSWIKASIRVLGIEEILINSFWLRVNYYYYYLLKKEKTELKNILNQLKRRDNDWIIFAA